MSECTYYEKEEIPTQRNPIGSNRQRHAPRLNAVPWCSHENSPVQKDIALSIGGGKELKCQGCLEECQIERDSNF